MKKKEHRLLTFPMYGLISPILLSGEEDEDEEEEEEEEEEG